MGLGGGGGSKFSDIEILSWLKPRRFWLYGIVHQNRRKKPINWLMPHQYASKYRALSAIEASAGVGLVAGQSSQTQCGVVFFCGQASAAAKPGEEQTGPRLRA